MKIAVDKGHTITGLGTGAVGIVKETDINRQVGNLLINYLKQGGHTVYDCTVDKSENDLYDRVQLANKTDAEIFVSIHLNAGGGHGTETYIYNSSYSGKEENRKIAQNVNTEVVNSCGFRNRGVKEANFYVIRQTKMKAILVELFFVDSSEDNGKYNVVKIAKALYKGLVGKDVTVSQPTTPTPTTKPTTNISVGCKVKITGSNYATGQVVPNWVKQNTYTVTKISDNKALLSDIVSWVYLADLQVVSGASSQPTTAPQSIRVGTKVKIVGSNYATGQVVPNWVKNNTYSVTQISGDKALLSDIISWVYKKDLKIVSGSVAQAKTLKVGSKVKIIGSNYATGQSVPNWVKQNTYEVIEISGSKSLLGGIMSWVQNKDLQIL